MKHSFGKQWFKLSIALCALSSISPLSFAAETPTEVNAKPAVTAEQAATQAVAPANNSFIFLQSAKEATIEQIKDKPNTYKMTLKNIYPQVTYVSDRPARKTGNLTHEKFVEEWYSKYKESLSNDAPNAFLNGVDGNKTSDTKTVSFTIKLSQPTLDLKNHSITYIINPLDPKEAQFIATTLHDVTLLIDDACLSCW